MDMKAVYEAVGGDYDAVVSRLMKEDRIEKYFKVFMADTLVDQLKEGLASQDYDAMFLAAHTLKGNSDTLGLTKLHESAVELTEALRANDYSNVDALLSAVLADYEAIEAAVAAA